MKKFTNKEVLAMVLEVLGSVEHEEKEVMVETVSHMIEQLTKKAENKKLTKAQQLNEALKVQLLDVLATEENGLTISELQFKDDFSEYSNQKLSALLNQLVKSGELEKEVGKDKKTIFKKVA